MVIYVPSKLYRYIIDTELQRSAESIFCVVNFVLFRASLKKSLFMNKNCKFVTLISLNILIYFQEEWFDFVKHFVTFSRGMVCKLFRSFFGQMNFSRI